MGFSSSLAVRTRLAAPYATAAARPLTSESQYTVTGRRHDFRAAVCPALLEIGLRRTSEHARHPQVLAVSEGQVCLI
jgi:hypothetical protein